MFEAPEAVLACSTLRCGDQCYMVFGGHDKTLYLMDTDLTILDSITFDGWVRSTYAIDLDQDGCDEILVGAGDGQFNVVKFVKGIDKLAGIMSYKSLGKVLCVTAGDFTKDGNNELIHGSEDKTLKIFENIDSEEPKFILYYDSWVTSCNLGYLKLPGSKDIISGLLAGTKNGALQLIQIKEEKPDIIWQREFRAQINAIEVGDVTNNGFHEIVIGTDDSNLTILNNEGEIIKDLKIEGGRPISIKIVDIDDDNAKEIIVGCADGSLRIYHNPNIDSSDIELKWKASGASSIKIVSTMTDPKEGLTNIIFGGYDRSLRCISDFECGEKPTLEIPRKMAIKKLQPQKKVKETDFEESSPALKVVPTNIRDYIFKTMEDRRIIEGITKELQNRGYTPERIEEEFNLMKQQKPDSFDKISYSIWSLPKEQVGEGGIVSSPVKQTKKLKTMVIEESDQTNDVKSGGALIDALKKEAGGTPKPFLEENLKYIIAHYVESNKLISSKKKIITDVSILGYDQELVEDIIDELKEKGVIKYSRNDPKGWSIAKK